MIAKIDAHHHCWHFDVRRHSWIDDSMEVIQRDFLPQHLEPLLEKNGVTGTVLVQVEQTAEENHYLLALAHSNPVIKGLVGWIDLLAPDLEQQLERWSAEPLMKGFRHIAQAEPDDFLCRPDVIKGIGMLEKYGFTYDILIKPTQIAAAIQLVKVLPRQMFVIDHLAKPYIMAGLLEPWKHDMAQLAVFENVYCKVSGMVTEADWPNWKYNQLLPYMETIFTLFGARRLMFGSDWPVCLLAADYDAVVANAARFVATCSPNEQQAFWQGNARRFYHL
jgi:L-fuconolactonase